MISDIRLRNLRLLISQYGRQRLLADAAQMNPTHLSQIVTGRRGLGENLARRIEETLGLPHLWLDQDQSDGVPPPAPTRALEGVTVEELLTDKRPGPAGAVKETPGNYDVGTLRLAREIESLPPTDRALFQGLLRRLLNPPPGTGR